MFACLSVKGPALGLPLQEGQLELSLGIVESTDRAANRPSQNGQELGLIIGGSVNSLTHPSPLEE